MRYGTEGHTTLMHGSRRPCRSVSAWQAGDRGFPARTADQHGPLFTLRVFEGFAMHCCLHRLFAAVLLAAAGAGFADDQAVATEEAPEPAIDRGPPMLMPPWAGDAWQMHREMLARQREARRHQHQQEHSAKRKAIEADREVWLQRWARERTQAREERRAREEVFRREQAERFPQLRDYRRRHAEEFEQRWHEIQARLEQRSQSVEREP